MVVTKKAKSYFKVGELLEAIGKLGDADDLMASFSLCSLKLATNQGEQLIHSHFVAELEQVIIVQMSNQLAKKEDQIISVPTYYFDSLKASLMNYEDQITAPSSGTHNYWTNLYDMRSALQTFLVLN